MMHSLYRKLRFKREPVGFKRSANTSLDPTLLPRTQIASLRTKAAWSVMSGVEPLPAMVAVNPKMVSYPTSVRAGLKNIATFALDDRERFFTVLTCQLNALAHSVDRLCFVMASHRAESWRSLATPNCQTRIAALFASRSPSLGIVVPEGLPASSAAQSGDVLHVKEANSPAVHASVCVGVLREF